MPFSTIVSFFFNFKGIIHIHKNFFKGGIKRSYEKHCRPKARHQGEKAI